jgi:hypothetical protein
MVKPTILTNTSPSPDFDPVRNRKVVEDTIKKHDAMRKKKMDEFNEALYERTEAVNYFLHHVDNGKDPNIDKYFGRKVLAELRGQKLIQEIEEKAIKLSYIE